MKVDKLKPKISFVLGKCNQMGSPGKIPCQLLRRHDPQGLEYGSWNLSPWLGKQCRTLNEIFYLIYKLAHTVGIFTANMWITNFYLSSIHMVVLYSDHHSNTCPVFKCWSEYWTKFSIANGPDFECHLNSGLIFEWFSQDGIHFEL